MKYSETEPCNVANKVECEPSNYVVIIPAKKGWYSENMTKNGAGIFATKKALEGELCLICKIEKLVEPSVRVVDYQG